MNDDDSPICKFESRIENARMFTNILNCLMVPLKTNQICHVEVTPEVLMFVVSGRGKSTQGRVSFTRDFFEEYSCDKEEEQQEQDDNLTARISDRDRDRDRAVVERGRSQDQERMLIATSTTVIIQFSLNLNTLLDLSLEESGVLTTCEMGSLLLEEFEELQSGLFSVFRDHEMLLEIVIKSEAMKEVSEVFGAVAVTICCNHTEDTLTTEMWQYSLSSLQTAMKALPLASETFLRINSRGMACVQHQIPTSGGLSCSIYLDFHDVDIAIITTNNANTNATHITVSHLF
eukprot:gene9170-19001_t